MTVAWPSALCPMTTRRTSSDMGVSFELHSVRRSDRRCALRRVRLPLPLDEAEEAMAAHAEFVARADLEGEVSRALAVHEHRALLHEAAHLAIARGKAGGDQRLRKRRAAFHGVLRHL